MSIKRNKVTNRLHLVELKSTHASFILELLNTEDWIKFIGDRNVRTLETAEIYIQNILNNKHVDYWVVQLKNEPVPIGIITFVKRTYLEFHDIGFAFLPEFRRKGYAEEAARTVLQEMVKFVTDDFILATTLKENKVSIKLLEKLGMKPVKVIKPEGEELLVYSISRDRIG